MAKKPAKIKKNFDSYIYAGVDFETTREWIEFLGRNDSGSPEMKGGLKEEKAGRKDEIFYQGYLKYLKKQRKTHIEERLRFHVDVFRRRYAGEFRRYPFLKHLVDGLEYKSLIKQMGVIQ